jgi:hypothetical protein
MSFVGLFLPFYSSISAFKTATFYLFNSRLSFGLGPVLDLTGDGIRDWLSSDDSKNFL